MEEYFTINSLRILIKTIEGLNKLIKKNKANKMNRYEWCLSCVKLVGKVVVNAICFDE